MDSLTRLREQYDKLEHSYDELLYLAARGTTWEAQESGMALAAAQQVLALSLLVFHHHTRDHFSQLCHT